MTTTRQASYFNILERRRGAAYPPLDLFRTHRFPTSATNIATATVFPSRSGPIVFSFALTRTGVGAGVVFEFGSDVRGVAAWCAGNDLGIAAGTGTGTPNNGVTITLTNVLSVTGRRFRFTVSIIPAKGLVEVFRDGRKMARAVAVAGTFNGDWADSGAGAVTNLQGTVNDRVPVGQRVALANVTFNGFLSAFAKQRVRL